MSYIRNGRKNLAAMFRQQPRWLLLNACVLVVLAIGYIDYFTGYELSMFLFYGGPILFAVWFTDKKSAIFIAVLSALVWWWADAKSGHPYLENWIQVYNAVMRLCFYLFVVVGGSAMKEQHDSDSAKIELLEHSHQLEREIIKISEREQRRFGQDLHDGLCQYFAAVGCAAVSLRNDLEKISLKEASAAGEIAEFIKQGVIQARNLSHGLFPVQEDESALQTALAELTANASKMLNIKCSLQCPDPVPVHDNAVATHLYRIAQEALHNANKHGHASEVTVELSAQNESVKLRVVDNGGGLEKPQNAGRGMGIKIMNYRARLIGGQLEIGQNPAGGTVVACSFLHNTNPGAEAHDEQAA
jgi:signal transduction histidine kinase